MRSGVLTWCVCVLREKNACAPFLYDRNVLTAATILMTLPLCGLLSVFIWHLDIRARRIWVHGIIHSRQTYSEYDHLGQEQEKEQRWRHQHLSEKLIFQLEVLGTVALWKKILSAAPFPRVSACCCRCLLFIGNKRQKTLDLRKKCYSDKGPKAFYTHWLIWERNQSPHLIFRYKRNKPISQSVGLLL